MPNKTLQVDLKHLGFVQKQGSLIFEHPRGYVIELVQTFRSEESFGTIVTTMFWDGIPVLVVSHDRGGGNTMPEDGTWQWQWICNPIAGPGESLFAYDAAVQLFDDSFMSEGDEGDWDLLRIIMNAMQKQDSELSDVPHLPVEE